MKITAKGNHRKCFFEMYFGSVGVFLVPCASNPCFSMPFGCGGYLPRPHSAFGGCGLPHNQITENLKASDNVNQKPTDSSLIYVLCMIIVERIGIINSGRHNF